MLRGLLGRVVGDSNEREIRKLQPLVDAINAREPEMERRTDAELRALTDQFRARLAAGATLNDVLAEAFAAAREAAKRTVAMRPFDVQLIGGIVLHQGRVAEMKTGEGKTLVATLPVTLNALGGQGVHLVTVNDYLARRDTLWMGPIYHLLGITVGLLQSGMEQPAYVYDPSYQRDPYPGLRPVPRREAYAADVTYGTNNEFGFDYLRDNLALALEARVQRPLNYAIVDEVDNIFIDEARTPLIISGRSGESVEDYGRFAAIARQLETGVHYELDEKERSVFLTDEGLAVIERETGIENIYDEANYRYVHFMEQALKAQVLFQEGKDYIRQRKQIVLIDHHTGRLMANRRLSEGLHQAIEAKEGVPVQPRDVTSATITIQNYFRMYKKLAGMSGTAVTEGEEFFKIYALDVLPIPTNRPMIRTNHSDVVYRSEDAKLRAVVREILACHGRGQPVLVGTTSVEMSERVSTRLGAERLQMAAMAPRVAVALQDANLDRDERSRLREVMNSSLETMNSAAWRKLWRDLGLESNALSSDNLDWIAEYLGLPETAEARQAIERALREGITHQVLNAKEHTREAAVIARAGEPGAVTIATNMAGRGVDIRLGGELTEEVIQRAHQALRARGLDPFKATSAQMDSAVAEVIPQYAKRRDQVLAAGGLHILGTERHEARRIDNQLRGRSGRQGEPGSSRFSLSLEDDLMRRFGRKEMLSKLMEQMGDDFPIEHSLVSKTIERAQTSVEGYNFDIRKHLLEYDDVLNRQRDSIYAERLRILQTDDVRPEILRMLEVQTGEYLEKLHHRDRSGLPGAQAQGTSQDRDQLRLLFAGLDDIVPLILPSPSAPFRGAVPFGGHLTAFPPFTISFLADQVAGQPLETVQQALRELPRRAAAAYGEVIGQSVGETVRTTAEKYDERLDRYRSLLDEKVDDYAQLAEERKEAPDARRLAQYLERTYPMKLSTPPELLAAGIDDLRDNWLAQIEVEFHRLTCDGLIARIQSRLPAEAVSGLDRVRPSLLSPEKLADELRRLLELAGKQPRDGPAHKQLAQVALPSNPKPEQVWEFITTVKRTTDLDLGRLDRLVGHVLGAELDELMGQFQEAGDTEQRTGSGTPQTRLRRDLERLRDSVVEGKKGGRADLTSLLRQLNDLVHLELTDLEASLGKAVAHEYDKWAQRQVAEDEANSARSPLTSTSWGSIAEYLLATHYTQKQVYDKDHRRFSTWMPRLPFGYVAQAHVENMDQDELRDAFLGSLRWAIELREQTWGRQEIRRWGHLTLHDLDESTYDGLVCSLGEEELGEQRDSRLDELSPDLYAYVHFLLSLRQYKEERLGNLPRAEELLGGMSRALEGQMLDTPVGELDKELQQRVEELLRHGGVLQDATARAQFVQQPIRDWDRRSRDEVAGFWGGQLVEAYQRLPLAQLEPEAREAALAYMQRQRRFVDEEQVQRFLVHQSLEDLPPQTRQAAVHHVARSRLDRISRRKIASLDGNTRQQVLSSLQKLGMFTDQGRRDGILTRSLSDLPDAVRSGFGVFLARQLWDSSHSLNDLGDPLRSHVVQQLRQTELLANPERLSDLPGQRLSDLPPVIASQIQHELVAHLRAEVAAKKMEELPAATRREIHQVLDDQNYFVDEDKVNWYERKTLAQLPTEMMLALETHLGQIRLAELAGIPFRELPSETQSKLLALFDGEGLLGDRAERLRLTQTGTLGDLGDRDRVAVIRSLGRQWLVQIRDRRPPSLPDPERETVRKLLRDQGYFRDEFKEELFAYQRLDEFGVETQQVVEQAMIARLTRMLDTQPIGKLPTEVQAEIRARLKQADVLVDEDRVRQMESFPPAALPGDVRQAVENVLGEAMLTNPSNLGHVGFLAGLPSGQRLDSGPIGLQPAEIQAALWRYLDEIGYFLDEKKRSQTLDRRLVDLGNEALEEATRDLALQLEAEIGGRPVSELDDDLRQGLRAAVEAQGYFESKEAQAQILGQPLGALPRADLEALAVEFGQARLNGLAERRLGDLPLADQEAVISHLEARDWFLDRARLEQMKSQKLRDLTALRTGRPGETSLRPDFVETLRQQQIDRLRQQRLMDLDREQRRAAYQVLYEQGFRLDENQMRSLRSRKVSELEPDVTRDLLRELGGQAIADWGATRFQDLEGPEQDRLSAYLGRRIMSRIERRVLLHTISRLWIDYLTDIEDLRRGIGLEAYGQRDPLVEYKRKAFELFEELADNTRRDVVRSLYRQMPEPLRA